MDSGSILPPPFPNEPPPLPVAPPPLYSLPSFEFLPPGLFDSIDSISFDHHDLSYEASFPIEESYELPKVLATTKPFYKDRAFGAAAPAFGAGSLSLSAAAPAFGAAAPAIGAAPAISDMKEMHSTTPVSTTTAFSDMKEMHSAASLSAASVSAVPSKVDSKLPTNKTLEKGRPAFMSRPKLGTPPRLETQKCTPSSAAQAFRSSPPQVAQPKQLPPVSMPSQPKQLPPSSKPSEPELSFDTVFEIEPIKSESIEGPAIFGLSDSLLDDIMSSINFDLSGVKDS